MANPYFRFKQFTVFHDKCAMKVGTDGMLLGAWTDLNGTKIILDVGTGTGLIALMLAQRNPAALIEAIDIDPLAQEQAETNSRNSPFSDRISVKRASLQEFARLTGKRFDLIVSNPPYFSDSLMPADKQRAQTRHAVTLTLDDLLFFSRCCLAEGGRLSLILPYDRRDELKQWCVTHAFYLKRETFVHPTPSAERKRVLVELSTEPIECIATHSLIIEEKRHVYTSEFTHLVRDFYVHL